MIILPATEEKWDVGLLPPPLPFDTVDRGDVDEDEVKVDNLILRALQYTSCSV
jgi:hypothetical protein